MSAVLVPYTNVRDTATDAVGLFLGWTEDGDALVWWDGQDGAVEVDPDTLEGLT